MPGRRVIVSPQGKGLAIVSTSPLTSAAIGVAYTSIALLAIGGTGGNTWALVSNTGTNTWAVSPSGVITGTPGTAAGIAAGASEDDNITVKVTDALGNTARATFFLGVISPQWADPIPVIGTQGVPYAGYTLTSIGGILPYTFVITPGNPLPGGLSLNPSTGAITGTPTVSGTLIAESFDVLDSSP